MSIGKIAEFDLRNKNWNTYISRLEQYFIANEIEDKKKKAAILIASVGDDTYELMVDLCRPKKPEEMVYEELIQVVKKHLQPEPSIIAERYKFRRKKQEEGESISEYVATLKKLAKFCNFGTSLDENLRDQLVYGIKNKTIKQRLFTESKLNFSRAYELALNMEAAERNTGLIERGNVQDLHHLQKPKPPASGNSSERPSTSRSKRALSTQQTRYIVCKCCGKNNHIFENCYFKNCKCFKCGKVGHIKSVCRSKEKKFCKVKNTKSYFVAKNSDSDSDLNFYHICSNTKPFKINVSIENCVLQMDTGSELSVINKDIYDTHFSKITLLKTNVKLKTYTGKKIIPRGYIKVNVNCNE